MAEERTYRGPAVLLLDGVETDVMADLTAYTYHHKEEWSGLLKAGNPLEDFCRFVDRPTVLRIFESGREGEVLLHGWGSKLIRAEGSGPAPF
ncbi:hypothetical protein [Streptomyces daliensis]